MAGIFDVGIDAAHGGFVVFNRSAFHYKIAVHKLLGSRAHVYAAAIAGFVVGNGSASHRKTSVGTYIHAAALAVIVCSAVAFIAGFVAGNCSA